ncbi:hypothetical protein WA026_020332 [Henosepilachna vigintioctopunctata]|uniref:Uncharacterized protein n=1 Tax=Henosepilachna vigintioctopunctata TaxID=420089 RepID=A0AAW1TWA0_9CUCU
MQSLPQHPLRAFIAPNAAMRSSIPSVHFNTEPHRAGRQTTPCPSTLDARKYPLQYRHPSQLIPRWPSIRFVSSASDPQRSLKDNFCKRTAHLRSNGIRCTFDSDYPSRWTQERSDGSTGTTPSSAAGISCTHFNCEDTCTQYPLKYRYPSQLIARWPFIRFVSSASDPQRPLKDNCCKRTAHLRSNGIRCTSASDSLPHWTQGRSDGSTGTTPASAASISCTHFNCEDICTQFPL